MGSAGLADWVNNYHSLSTYEKIQGVLKQKMKPTVRLRTVTLISAVPGAF